MFSIIRRCTLVLLLVLTISGLALPALAQTAAPSSDGWANLGFDQCALPCWAGLVPGESSFSDAIDTVNTLFVNEQRIPRSQGRRTGDIINYEWEIRLYDGGRVWLYILGEERVEQIVLSVTGTLTGHYPLGTLIRRSGAPDCIAYDGLSLGWENGGVQVEIPAPRPLSFRPGTSARQIHLQIGIYQPLCNPVRMKWVAWQGFAPHWAHTERSF